MTFDISYVGTGLTLTFMLKDKVCTDASPTLTFTQVTGSFSFTTASNTKLTWTSALATVPGPAFYLCWCGLASGCTPASTFNAPVSGALGVNGMH